MCLFVFEETRRTVEMCEKKKNYYSSLPDGNSIWERESKKKNTIKGTRRGCK